MKSILVLETPTNCIDCPLQADDKACGITETSFIAEKGFDPAEGKLKDCPLKDLPNKQVCNEYNFENYTNGINIGWNRCLAEITGEKYIPPKYKEKC